ncbi:rhodanese-related sulfurtransferase [Candidatus Nomurabacteria bacterium]|nr:MAG: rhodanese-related sulfurtransferase [Candidatus Nomurabacteria bacterium]
MKYTILLFYKYTKVKDPKVEMGMQRGISEVLGLTGRTIVAEEGINATLEGTTENIEKYITWMSGRRGFSDIHWKRSEGTGNAFPRLSVKVRPEIVSLHLGEEGDINPNKLTGKRLKPYELKKWYEENKDFYIVDMRNDYELKTGKFEGTIFPGLENFRDLREKVDALAELKDKTVLTVCTGGVRCEKASGFLKKEGFKDVYQLDGGIVSYMEKYPGENFKGSLYVFDGRVTMNFNGDKHEVVGRCDRCESPSEHYVNCGNLACHRHFICCENCLTESGEGFCSDECLAKKSENILTK